MSIGKVMAEIAFAAGLYLLGFAFGVGLAGAAWVDACAAECRPYAVAETTMQDRVCRCEGPQP